MHRKTSAAMGAVLVLLMCMLTACATSPRATASKPAPDADAQAGIFDVVTLNLYHDKADWRRRQQQIIAELRARQPDVIALQEVLQTAELQNQAQALAEALGYRFVFFSTDPQANVHRYGNALLTRLPIAKQAQVDLAPLDDHRTAGMLRLRSEGGDVDVYVTHLHWTDDGGAIRATQIQDLLAFIARNSGDGTAHVVAGDFNAPVDAPELAPLLASHLDSFGLRHPDASADDSTTLNPAWYTQRRRIDHILPQQGRWDVIDAGRLFTAPDANGTWASDHHGLQARLRLRQENAAPSTTTQPTAPPSTATP
jgi:beta-glucosidase